MKRFIENITYNIYIYIYIYIKQYKKGGSTIK